MSSRRKVPFSGKQKKLQLQLKKERKIEVNDHGSGGSNQFISNENLLKSRGNRRKRNATQCAAGSTDTNARCGFDPNRYRLQFYKDTKEELERRKQIGRDVILSLEPESLEYDIDTIFLPGSELDMPKRPQWSYTMSSDQLDKLEKEYFQKYLMAMESKFSLKELSYFEMNLETWRQLWRVLEMSDIIFIIVDIRFPALLFSPILYNHVAIEMKKSVVIILNKIDLAPPSLVLAWKHYFQTKFPNLHIIYFTSFAVSEVKSHTSDKKMQQQRPRGRVKMAAEGALKVMEACEQIVGGKLDLQKWRNKIHSELEDDDSGELPSAEAPTTIKAIETTYQPYERFQDKILTIGFIGQPNVGKSSIINSLMGKKVVSVSRTPGHTKHFQTIFLTDNVRLCDCPGLVFPSKIEKPLQVLAGSYPIAQLQEPYTSVRFLAQYIPIQKLLKLRHPEAEGNLVREFDWSAVDICEAWAELKGFKTAKAARNDAYRAANNILRMALDGRFCLCLRPPGYTKEIDKWSTHPEIEDIEKIVLKKNAPNEKDNDEFLKDSESEDELDQNVEESSDNSSDNQFIETNKFSVLSS